jgi:hypothetical protein
VIFLSVSTFIQQVAPLFILGRLIAFQRVRYASDDEVQLCFDEGNVRQRDSFGFIFRSKNCARISGGSDSFPPNPPFSGKRNSSEVIT